MSERYLKHLKCLLFIVVLWYLLFYAKKSAFIAAQNVRLGKGVRIFVNGSVIRIEIGTLLVVIDSAARRLMQRLGLTIPRERPCGEVQRFLPYHFHRYLSSTYEESLPCQAGQSLCFDGRYVLESLLWCSHFQVACFSISLSRRRKYL